VFSVVTVSEFSFWSFFKVKGRLRRFHFGFSMNAFDKCRSLLSKELLGMVDCNGDEVVFLTGLHNEYCHWK